jgi:dTDP-4-dehydrorhamnose 3,5-epimerase
MTDTIQYEEIDNWWNGKVIIRRIKVFGDNRGMVSEVFRLDSDITKDSKMCYISETNPFVLRGPHQHSAQMDFFVTWKSKMIYQMYNKELNEFKWFITDEKDIISVSVQVPILHSYRNLSNKVSNTLNFPTALFMGEGKKQPIDEIRWEEKFEHNKIVFILGAGGRLGKAITKTFLDNVGFIKYDVIPYYNKVTDEKDLKELFNNLQIYKDRDVYFINCAALTNVQDTKTQLEEWNWNNAFLPLNISYECSKNNWKFITFSTDYVYKDVFRDPYTLSKKSFERQMKKEKGNNSIIRVSNLYSNDINDTHNIIAKLKKNKDNLTLNSNVFIYPTDVSVLSKKIREMFLEKQFDVTKNTFFNVLSKKYNLIDFVKQELKIENFKVISESVENWLEKFETDKEAIKIHI